MVTKVFYYIFLAFLTMSGGCEPSVTPSPQPAHTPAPAPTGTMPASGIRGTTRYLEVSGVPGGPSTERPASIEFAIAPVEAGVTAYDRAIFVRSDAQGVFEVTLAPGTYWIGPKAKAFDPANFAPGAEEFTETSVVVREGAYITVDLVQTAYAP